MKNTVSIEIALPRERVVGLLADPDTSSRSGSGAWCCTSHSDLAHTGRWAARRGSCCRWTSRRSSAPRPSHAGEPVDLHRIPRDSVLRFEREIVGEGMWNSCATG